MKMTGLKPLVTGGLKKLDLSSLKSVHDKSKKVKAEKVMDAQRGLPSDLKYVARARRRQYRDLRQITAAEKHLERLPADGESFHCVISGKYSLWNVVPAILALAKPHRIERLTICTLGFSRFNVDALCQLLDSQDIGSVRLLCSHYFSATSSEIYEHAVGMLAQRPQASFKSMRTHCKLLCLALSDGRKLVVESSANLRSSSNIENMTIIADPDLHDFHVGWVSSLFAPPK